MMEKNENKNILKLTKPYTFEGKTYEEIDMSGLDNIKAIDMIQAERALSRTGGYYAVPEMELEYAVTIAASAARLPVEFFHGLPPRDALNVKNMIKVFFYTAD